MKATILNRRRALPVVIFDAPHSIMAESFRHIRTKLQHTASLDTTRSIMVTSPAPGDGKTTIACNLAAGLALTAAEFCWWMPTSAGPRFTRSSVCRTSRVSATC